MVVVCPLLLVRQDVGIVWGCVLGLILMAVELVNYANHGMGNTKASRVRLVSSELQLVCSLIFSLVNDTFHLVKCRHFKLLSERWGYFN